jgi:hypothetical protein
MVYFLLDVFGGVVAHDLLSMSSETYFGAVLESRQCFWNE